LRQGRERRREGVKQDGGKDEEGVKDEISEGGREGRCIGEQGSYPHDKRFNFIRKAFNSSVLLANYFPFYSKYVPHAPSTHLIRYDSISII
jgi:hypothetical protein